ncbi:Deoxyuridine 5'-triphosphate nucleotidohydrolase [Candidatus Liberibacter solanacearum]|uniref:Deoxyuridine 5'-triphosphate nucleotidohydrolase n=2 Tax=Candidatus Liberibacter solanacearum TaxID=556287 RepID=A0A094Z2G0_9HYPH|nr:dUTP diphosphatase [Candidatus Liberibacter solanacearum]ADR52605.1 deoxyuridine 5 27-triphosphate nucleotidohydrolase [Candidatus Liberibacter solanacearum CLso-ZC1]KGB27134.1 deoxyuridine 5'-triphosphate nucleotidohydrolase [Candidatus Liberibacter solanacearum]KJZ81237.1 deoxyuridine 5'-triphosphate nucleotidohydrolase [Candidatus Liberibacter solanacearum]KJZ81721.1 Deoxyuridine 5'-triphosphate nucleotidohydrolase [Candidatus Liberibacter solanacearum]KQC48977.1 deoxyuridine 5'-triphosp
MQFVHISFSRLPHAHGIPLPEYKTEGSSGMDLFAALAEDKPVELLPGMRSLIPGGYVVALPPGYEGQIRSRSGLALDHGISCLNSPGTIDSDYRGEIKILLINLGQENFLITRGMRIAQLVIANSVCVRANLVSEIPIEKSERGNKGFGSTGLY